MRPGALLQLLLEACLWFQLQKMVKCIVPSCHKKSDIERDVSFFPLPAIKRKNKALFQPSRKRNWLSCKDLSKTDLSQVRICSRHFINGRPANIQDSLNPDWLPTQNLTLESSSSNTDSTMQQRQARYMRRKTREAKLHIDSDEPSVSDSGRDVMDDDSPVYTAPCSYLDQDPLSRIRIQNLAHSNTYSNWNMN